MDASSEEVGSERSGAKGSRRSVIALVIAVLLLIALGYYTWTLHQKYGDKIARLEEELAKQSATGDGVTGQELDGGADPGASAEQPTTSPAPAGAASDAGAGASAAQPAAAATAGTDAGADAGTSAAQPTTSPAAAGTPGDGTAAGPATASASRAELAAQLQVAQAELTRLRGCDLEFENLAGGRRVLRLPSSALFQAGQAVVSPGGKLALLEIAIKIQAVYPGRKFKIIGHTDNLPIEGSRAGQFKNNLELSIARALGVIHVFAEVGLSEESFEVVGAGSADPLVDNRIPAGRAKNRRVELELLPDDTSRTQ